jgi:hypothetical protein
MSDKRVIIFREGFAIEYPAAWSKAQLALALKLWVDENLPPPDEPATAVQPTKPKDGGDAQQELVAQAS